MRKSTKPLSITKENFAPFGLYWNLRQEIRLSGENYEERITEDAPVYQPMRFGMTICKNGSSFVVDSMERHNTTEEVLFPADKPIVLSVADSDPAAEPKAGDIVSFLLQPGDVVSIKKGIWHDACHAVEGNAFYYFMAHGTGKGDEIVWHKVQGEPEVVEL